MTINFDFIHLLYSKLALTLRPLLFLFLLFVLFSCTNKSDEDTASTSTSNKTNEYADGTYCASITYYNPNTGTRSTYTLNVDVENNEMVKINWNNGGWLDDSHFNPPTLDNDGACSFTSDKGYKYDIEIKGPACSNTDIIPAEDDDNDEAATRREFTLTLFECAQALQMTERELGDYEKRFNANRNDVISEKMCNLMREYIPKMRETKEKMDNLNREIEDGYIQQVYSVGTEDNIRCQLLIVKRRGRYYLLEVNGQRKCTMGLMQFNPDDSGWQDVIVKETPNSTTMPVLPMRIIESSSEMYSLKEKMENYCTF